MLFHNPNIMNSGILEDFLKMCACCQTECDMEFFLQSILILPDTLEHIPRPGFKAKSKQSIEIDSS